MYEKDKINYYFKIEIHFYIIKETICFCKKNKIIQFYLSSYLTYIVQPLNITILRIFIESYKKILKKSSRFKIRYYIDKVDILRFIKKLVKYVFNMGLFFRLYKNLNIDYLLLTW